MTLHWRDMQDNMKDTSPLNTVLQFLMPWHQKFKNAKIYLFHNSSKLDCFCRSPVDVMIV